MVLREAPVMDKVQPLKIEDSSTGGGEVDQFPTSMDPQEDHVECAGIVFDDASHRDESVRVYRDGDDLKFLDNTNPVAHTLSDLLSGGLSEEGHRQLDQLTHEIDESSYDEVTRVGGKVISVTVWDGPSKLHKIREVLVTRVSGKVSQLATKQYDSSGALKETLTEVFSRVGGKISSITRTRM
jgi:hypothetical protein